MNVLKNRDSDIICYYLSGLSLNEISIKIEKIYKIKISRQRVYQILKYNGINTKSGGYNLVLKNNKRKKKLEKLKEDHLKKEIQLHNINKYFGVTGQNMKIFDKDFQVLPIYKYLNKNNLKSKYSFLYKKYLHSATFYRKKDLNYLNFLDWFTFLQKSDNIYYIKNIDKYDKKKYVFIKKINKDSPWTPENIKVNK